MAMASKTSSHITITGPDAVRNVILVGGQTFSPPDVICAIGDREALEAAQDERQARERFDRELDSFHRDPDAWKRSHPYDQERKRHRYDDDDYHRRKKKKGFDIFDIFD